MSIGLPVLFVVIIIFVLGILCQSHRRRRSLIFRRQTSQTSRSTVCTQLSVTGTSTAGVSCGTLRSTSRGTALTGDLHTTDSTDCA